jgi:hypothetical protein
VKPFDEVLIESIEFLPYRDEYIEVVSVLARYWPPFDAAKHLHSFLERVAVYFFSPRTASSWRSTDFDNFLFIVHELFLYTIAILIRHDRIVAVEHLLNTKYYLGGLADGPNQMMGFLGFRRSAQTFEIRNQRLKLGRASLRADLLERRSQSSGVTFTQLMQADFLLYLRSSVAALASESRQWWPDTLVYWQRMSGPFEVFARAQSASYFDRIKGMLGVANSDEFKDVVRRLGQQSQLNIPAWNYTSVEPRLLLGFDDLATTA